MGWVMAGQELHLIPRNLKKLALISKDENLTRQIILKWPNFSSLVRYIISSVSSYELEVEVSNLGDAVSFSSRNTQLKAGPSDQN